MSPFAVVISHRNVAGLQNQPSTQITWSLLLILFSVTFSARRMVDSPFHFYHRFSVSVDDHYHKFLNDIVSHSMVLVMCTSRSLSFSFTLTV